jgi:hypothetical protein
MSYYIGLSILSNTCKKLLSAEARRILSRLEGGEREIENGEQGRPFFPGGEVDFNIAHSGSIVAVSLVRGGTLRTGCDIELIRPRTNIREIAETYFSSNERDYIFSQGESSDKRFYEIWTLKECYLKLKGFSVFDMSCCPSFINDEGFLSFGKAVSRPLSFRLYELSGEDGEPATERALASEGSSPVRYILAAAIEGEQREPEILWFSQLSLACKMTAEINAAPNPAETVRPKI